MTDSILRNARIKKLKELCRLLNCEFHYAPTSRDNPPDTVIVTNREILEEQATTQAILEDLNSMVSFSFKDGAFKYSYHPDAPDSEIIANSIIEAVAALLFKKMEDGIVNTTEVKPS